MKTTTALRPIQYDASFNWLAILKDLAAGRPLNFVEHDCLRCLAAAWPTCACGQLCAALPRYPDGIPQDSRLRFLGTEFYHDVATRRWLPALDTFHRIEARTAELLEQQLNQSAETADATTKP